MKLLFFKKDPRNPIIGPNRLLKDLALMRIAGCSEEQLNERVKQALDEPIKDDSGSGTGIIK